MEGTRCLGSAWETHINLKFEVRRHSCHVPGVGKGLSAACAYVRSLFLSCLTSLFPARVCIRLLVGLNDIVSLSDYRQIYNSHTKLSKGRSCMHLDSMFCARFPLAPTSHPNSPSCASPLTSELHHRQTNFIGNDKPPI